MKIGCCIKVKDLDSFEVLPEFDFVEVKYSDLEEICTKVPTNKIYAVNNVYPRDKNIFEEDLDSTFEYFRKVLRSCADKGAKIITLGSGTARIFKENHNITQNLEKWCKILKELDTEAGRFGLKIGIEPLNAEETNFIKNVKDVAFFIDLLRLRNIGVTLDSYHFYKENDSINELIRNVEKVVHFHFASDERKYPLTITKKVRELFKVLTSSKYSGRTSIEIDWREELENDKNIIYEVKKL